MATIREYFDTDARALTMHGNWSFGTHDGVQLAEVIAKIAYDFEANAKYWYFYVPSISPLSECLSAIFKSADFGACRLRSEGDGVYQRSAIISGHARI